MPLSLLLSSFSEGIALTKNKKFGDSLNNKKNMRRGLF